MSADSLVGCQDIVIDCDVDLASMNTRGGLNIKYVHYGNTAVHVLLVRSELQSNLAILHLDDQ